MKHTACTFDLRAFLKYKFFNSFFTGLSVGSIFTLYTPLKPSVFSLGGVALALAMLLVAKFYTRIMNRYYFYRISLGVEGVMLFLVVCFLLFSYGYATALLIYAGYQLTFAFGAYLVRAETILIQKSKALTFVDVNKQKGYLAGMVISLLFYKTLEQWLGIGDNRPQVYQLHWLLLLTEIITVYYLIKAFRRPK